MKATIFITLVLITGLFIASCERQTTNEPPQSQLDNNQQIQEQQLEPEIDTTAYIESQIVDPSQDIEIGEMI